MGLPEVNRARIEKMIRDFDALQGKVDTIDPVVVDESYPDLVSGAPQGVTASALFRTIAVNWQYHAVSYIATYEVYASTEKDFTPRETHLVWRGKAGGFNFPASTGETWYFRVRTLNYHGNASEFSAQVSATTVDVSGLEIDEQYQIDTIEYANQYTEEREAEIMKSVADKLDATVYHENIVLKADTATVEDMFDDAYAELQGKVDKTVYDDAMDSVGESITTIEGTLGGLGDTSSNLLQRVSDNESELEAHGGTLTTLTTDVNEVEGTLSVAIDTLNNLGDTVSAQGTSIEANETSINLKANQEELDTVSGDVSTISSELSVHAGLISAKAEQSELETLEGNVNSVSSDVSALEVSVDGIGANVTSLEGIVSDQGEDISSVSSEVDIVAGAVSTKVEQTDFNSLSDDVTTLDSNVSDLIVDVDGITASVTSLESVTGEHETEISDAISRLSVVEGEITSFVKETTYTEDMNGIVSDISSMETSISQNASEIELKASQSDLNDATGRLTDAEAQISVNKDAIEQRVTQETYDKDISDEGTGLFARMTSAEGSITTLAGEVELKATEDSVVTRIGDVVDSYEGLEARVTVNETSITNRVTHDTYNALEQRVGTAEGSITTLAGEVELKASISDLDGVDSRLGEAESTLSVLPDSIESKVEKDGVMSAIRQTPESLKIDVAQVEIDGDLIVENGLVRLKDAIIDRVNIKDGILTQNLFAENAIVDEINTGTAKIDFAQIGDVAITNAHISGRLTANQITIGSGTSFGDGYDPTKMKFGGNNLISHDPSKWTNFGDFHHPATPIDIEPNTTYTLTAYFDYSSSNIVEVFLALNQDNFDNIRNFHLYGNGENRKSVTFTTNSDEKSFLPIIANSDSNFYNRLGDYYRVKLEKGTVSTDWSVSSEDTVRSDNIISSINLTQETATISAENIELVGAVNVLSDITGNLGSITAGDITGVDIKGATITQEGTEGSITLNNEGFFFESEHGSIRMATSEALYGYDNSASIKFSADGFGEMVILQDQASSVISTDSYLSLITPSVSIHEDASLPGKLEFYGTGVNHGIQMGFGNQSHVITKHNTNSYFVIYPQRYSGQDVFRIRSHHQKSSYRDDFRLNLRGEIISPPTRDNPVTWGGRAAVGASSGRFGFVSSASKYKLLIEDVDVDPYNILELNPKSWYDKNNTEEYAEILERQRNGEDVDMDVEKIERIGGLIAEDLDEAGLSLYVNYNDKGEVEGVDYDRVWTLLIPIVRDHEAKIKALEDKILELQGS